MSTIKSSNEHLTLNADGSGNDIKFQSNGSEVASISDGGVITATTFSGAATDSTKLPLAGGAMTGAITSAGDLNFDAASDIALDADGGKIKFRDNGDDIAYLENNSGDLLIKSITDDKDIKIQGKDGGSFITAVQFDMSDNGKALFNNDVKIPDNAQFQAGDSADLKIYHSSSDNNSYIDENGSGSLYVRGNDLILGKYTGETYIDCNQDGAVELYYNNSKKLQTTSTGTTVTGTQLLSGNCYVANDYNVGNQSTHERINFNATSQHMSFYTGDTEEMRLENDGDLHVDGDVIAYSTTVSDERLKDNIEVVDGALDKVKELKGVTFTRKQDGQKSAGVIAQDVEKVLPEAVKRKALPLHTGDDELFKTVQYDALHALLIEAVKELSEKVEKLENK